MFYILFFVGTFFQTIGTTSKTVDGSIFVKFMPEVYLTLLFVLDQTLN